MSNHPYQELEPGSPAISRKKKIHSCGCVTHFVYKTVVGEGSDLKKRWREYCLVHKRSILKHRIIKLQMQIDKLERKLSDVEAAIAIQKVQHIIAGKE